MQTSKKERLFPVFTVWLTPTSCHLSPTLPLGFPCYTQAPVGRAQAPAQPQLALAVFKLPLVPSLFPCFSYKAFQWEMERDISNTFIKEQVTSFLLAKAIYEMSLTSPDFTMCRAPSVRALGHQPGVTRWGRHGTRGLCENTLLKWLRFTLPEFTCIVLLDKVRLARCVLAMLQTALGLFS